MSLTTKHNSTQQSIAHPSNILCTLNSNPKLSNGFPSRKTTNPTVHDGTKPKHVRITTNHFGAQAQCTKPHQALTSVCNAFLLLLVVRPRFTSAHNSQPRKKGYLCEGGPHQSAPQTLFDSRPFYQQIALCHLTQSGPQNRTTYSKNRIYL